MNNSVKTDQMDLLLYAAMAAATPKDLAPDDASSEIPRMQLSPKAERRIWKRIRRETEYTDAQTGYHPIREQLKRAALIFLVITSIGFTCMMSVEAIRNAVFQFFVQWYEKSIHVQLAVDDNVDAPTTILTYKEPIVGEEFERYEIQRNENNYIIEYESTDTLIVYHQDLLHNYNKALSNNETELFKIEMNGYEAMYTQYETFGVHMVSILWHDGEYAYSLSANMDFETLYAIAQTVQ